jgi:hypothetical protein
MTSLSFDHPGSQRPGTLASPFTPKLALEAGISRKRLRALVDAKEVRRVLTGVYAWSSDADSVMLRCRAARLVTAPHLVLCDRTAAWIWGVECFDYRELEVLPPLETWALRGRNRVSRAGCQGGERDLWREDVVEVHGLTVTTPLRTALDLACRLTPRDALAVVDAFMRDHGIRTDELQRTLARFRGRRGVVQARAIVAVADARAESPGESWIRWAMIETGLPVPELQCWVHVDGIPTFRLDMAYPKHRIAIEYDGREFHSSPDQRRHDQERRDWLRAHGWTVIVVDRSKLSAAHVRGWTDQIAEALGWTCT